MPENKNLRTVAFCVPNMIIGGVENILINTLKSLSEYPCLKFCIVTHAKIQEPTYVQWLKEHPEIPVYVYYPLCNWFESISKYTRLFPLKQLRKIVFSIYKKYRRIIMSYKQELRTIDIFVDYKNLEFARELRTYNVRKIAWIHGPVEYILKNRHYNKLAQYDAIVGLTNEFVLDFKQNLPKFANKVHQIYNPINAQAIRDMAKIGERQPGKYFCQISRLDATQKDIETLINAFDIFWTKNKHPDVKLLIIGSGPDETRLKLMAQSKQSHTNIIFTGKTTNPFGYLQNAIASILSTKYEGLPTVLIESAALGVPVISAACKNGPQEILENGHAGFLFPVGDHNALAQQMEYVFHNPHIAKEKAAIATKGLARFDSTKISHQIFSLLRS